MTVSVREVAALAGVSVGTVSNVLNNRPSVSPAVAERVRAAVAELGYIPNAVARQLRAGQSRTVALVVLDVTNPFFADVARGAEERAAEAGYVALVGSTNNSAEREDAYVEQFREQRVAGVVITPSSDGEAPAERLRSAGIPVVVIGSPPAAASVPSITVDDVRGGYLAASHLLEQGRRSLAFLAGPLAIAQVHDRLVGAQQAVAQYPDAQLRVVEVDEMTVLAGRAAADEHFLHAPRPAGVFAANDLLALGVLQALTMRSSVRVPEDVALVGYDDIDFAAAAVVPLTSVRQPARQLGYQAVDILLRGETGAAQQIRFQPELVVRTSSAALPTT
jgi:LacI family transcriptional regulator